MIRAVFFDIDNTLLDFDAYVKESMRTGFEKFGLPPFKEEMFAVFLRENNALWRQLEKGELTFDELQGCRWNNIFKALDFTGDGPAFERYFRDCLHESAIPVAGAENALKRAARYPLYAASNGPHEQQMHRLALGGMLPYFTQVFTSEGLGVSKPDPRFFALCFEKLNVGRKNAILPGEVLMVGDSLSSDIAGGIAAGMQTCWFDREKKGLPAWAKADHVITDLFQLEMIL